MNCPTDYSGCRKQVTFNNIYVSTQTVYKKIIVTAQNMCGYAKCTPNVLSTQIFKRKSTILECHWLNSAQRNFVH